MAKTQQEVSNTVKTSSQYRMQAKLSKRPTKVEPSSSATSLEYSDNGSNLDSTLLGQNFTAEGSMSSPSRNGSTEDDISLQTSSSVSVVPTDEELFATGWAKALDPKSGNYYYFTLDRKTIVWDNPLSQSADASAS